MPGLRIGIQLASLRQPLKRALQTAARLGAETVEIDARGELRPSELTATARRQLRKMLDDLQLRVAAVGFRTRRGYNVAEDLQRRIDATKSAMQFAFELGAPVVVNHVGRIPEETAGPEWDMLLDALTDIGQCAQRCGAWLAACTGSERPEQLRQLIGALPEGSLMVALHPGLMAVNAFSPIEAVQELSHHIQYVYATDGVRDLAQGRGLQVPIGRGTVDFSTLLGTLEESGYRGPFVIARDSSPNPVPEVADAVEYLRRV